MLFRQMTIGINLSFIVVIHTKGFVDLHIFLRPVNRTDMSLLFVTEIILMAATEVDPPLLLSWVFRY
jgi:hypothetical protein